MIFSKKCIDPTAGFYDYDNVQRPKKLGYDVLTIEECEKINNLTHI